MLVPCLVIFVTVRKLDPPYLSNYATRLTSEGLWFDSWQRKEVFSSKRPDGICSSSSLLVSACRGICTRCVKLATAPHIVHIVPRLKVSRAIIPLSRIHSWHARRQIFTLIYPNLKKKLPSFYPGSNIICDIVQHPITPRDFMLPLRSR
jgi:hypothetical protein